MGKSMKGSSKHVGNAPLATPEQQEFLKKALEGLGPEAGGVLSQLLGPEGGFDPEQLQSLFQQSFVDPAMLQYERSVLPAIQQRFVDAGAGSSSGRGPATRPAPGTCRRGGRRPRRRAAPGARRPRSDRCPAARAACGSGRGSGIRRSRTTPTGGGPGPG